MLGSGRIRRPRSLRSSEAGYTFIELAVTLAMVGIVSAMGMTRIPGLIASYNVSGTTSQIANEIRLTRMRAVTQNARARLRFNGNTYVRERESPAGSNTYVTDGETATLPNGLSVTLANGNPMFDSRGLPVQQYSLTLSGTYATTRTITVTTIGRVNVS
jgi:prepilin-type N-terminal cleavage/methylation domain-containing protein